MPIEYESCYSSSKLIERLEKLQQESYIFRGQSDASWSVIPNAFRKASLKEFEENFPARLDCLQWPESSEINQIVIAHLGKPIQDLLQPYALQHRRLSKYIIYLMQYNYAITQYYSNLILRGEINEQQLPEEIQNLLRNMPAEHWAEKNTFITGVNQILLTATPYFDIKTSALLNEPFLEQQVTSYDETWPQHYGFRSAAVDWSKDLHVALYFANHKHIDSDLNVQSEQSKDMIQVHTEMPDETPSHFAIFCYKEINDQDNPIKIMAPDNWNENRNAQAQKGLFTYFTEPFSFFLREGQLPCLEDYRKTNKFALIKLTLEPTKKDRANIKQLLLSKNINKNTIFPKQ